MKLIVKYFWPGTALNSKINPLAVCLFGIGLWGLTGMAFDSWQRVEVPTKDGLHDIEWVTQQIGYAYTYGTGQVLKTENGGNSWKIVNQLDSVYYEQIQFFDKNNGWICGNKNTLLKTSDGGKNWIRQTVGIDTAGMAFYGMTFKNPDTGYVAQLIPHEKGLTTRLYQTYDGGSNWKPVHTLDHMILNLEWNNNVLWGSGKDVIIKDVNKTERWTYSYRDTSGKVGQIRDLSFLNDGSVLAVSFNGYVLNKSSGGEWKQEKLTSNHLRSIKTVGNRYRVAAGDKNKEEINLFVKERDKEWKSSKNGYPDIHRLAVRDKEVWAVGKDGLVMHRQFEKQSSR